MCRGGGRVTTQATCSRMREIPSSRSTPRHGAMRCYGLRYMIFAGMTCGTPSLLGIVRPVHRRMSCRGWEDGKRNPWWSDMRTLRLKVCNLQLCGWMDFCDLEMMFVESCQLWSHHERTCTTISRSAKRCASRRRDERRYPKRVTTCQRCSFAIFKRTLAISELDGCFVN